MRKNGKRKKGGKKKSCLSLCPREEKRQSKGACSPKERKGNNDKGRLSLVPCDMQSKKKKAATLTSTLHAFILRALVIQEEAAQLLFFFTTSSSSSWMLRRRPPEFASAPLQRCGALSPCGASPVSMSAGIALLLHVLLSFARISELIGGGGTGAERWVGRMKPEKKRRR